MDSIRHSSRFHFTPPRTTSRALLLGPQANEFDGLATRASFLTSKAAFSGGFSAAICGTATPRLSGGRRGVILASGGGPGGAGKSAEGKREERAGPTAETSPLVRFAWYASEAFGKAVATVRGGEAEGGKGKGATAEGEPAVVERDAAIKALREDYDKSYFVTGDWWDGTWQMGIGGTPRGRWRLEGRLM
ncbi:unnamed protein product [Closterium sp. NIES-54]